MTKLLIDVGNSRLKWGIWQQSQLSNIGAMSLREWSDQVLTLAWTPFQISEIWISNVASPKHGESLTKLAQQNFALSPRFVHSVDKQMGVTNAYQHPEQLGVDRWLSLIAAHRLVPGNCLVISLGSAVTIDQLRVDGQHLGGLIVPGISLMIQALNMHTYGVKVTDFKVESASHRANNTADAVAFGALIAVTATIEQVFRQFREQVGEAVCVLTGGDSEIISAQLSMEKQQIPHLVLHGLGIVADSLNDGET